jgi:hypothetical protein
MDTVKQALIWIVIAAAASSIWAAILWVLWQDSIRPRLIPRAEIDTLAAELLARQRARSGGGGLRRRRASMAQFAPFRAKKVAARTEAD